VEKVDWLASWLPILGACMLAFHLLFFWLRNKHFRKKNYLLVIHAVLTLFNALGIYATKLGKSPNDVFCLDNAVPRELSDGPSLCIAQSAIVMFSTYGIYLSWFLHTVELYVKIVLERPSKMRLNVHLAIIMGCSLAETVYFSVRGFFGFTQASIYPDCFLSGSTDFISFVIFFVPLLIMSVAGVFALSAVIVKSFIVFRRQSLTAVFIDHEKQQQEEQAEGGDEPQREAEGREERSSPQNTNKLPATTADAGRHQQKDDHGDHVHIDASAACACALVSADLFDVANTAATIGDDEKSRRQRNNRDDGNFQGTPLSPEQQLEDNSSTLPSQQQQQQLPSQRQEQSQQNQQEQPQSASVSLRAQPIKFSLIRIVQLSSDMIIYNSLLAALNFYLFYSITKKTFVDAERNRLLYASWVDCVFISFAANPSDSYWLAKCGSGESLNLYGNPTSVQFKVFITIGGAFFMSVSYIPGLLLKWFYGPAKQPVVRRRWLVPDTLRIMKRLSVAPLGSFREQQTGRDCVLRYGSNRVKVTPLQQPQNLEFYVEVEVEVEAAIAAADRKYDGGGGKLGGGFQSSSVASRDMKSDDKLDGNISFFWCTENRHQLLPRNKAIGGSVTGGGNGRNEESKLPVIQREHHSEDRGSADSGSKCIETPVSFP
jgi:hypothetical protein